MHEGSKALLFVSALITVIAVLFVAFGLYLLFGPRAPYSW